MCLHDGNLGRHPPDGHLQDPPGGLLQDPPGGLLHRQVGASPAKS